MTKSDNYWNEQINIPQVKYHDAELVTLQFIEKV